MNFIQIDNYTINVACIEALYLEKRTILVYMLDKKTDKKSFHQVIFKTIAKAKANYIILANKLTNTNEKLNT